MPGFEPAPYGLAGGGPTNWANTVTELMISPLGGFSAKFVEKRNTDGDFPRFTQINLRGGKVIRKASLVESARKFYMLL